MMSERTKTQNDNDLSGLTVVNATPAQHKEFVRIMHAHGPWSDGMSIEAFQGIVDREFAEGGWAQDHADLVWVLVRRDDTQGEVFAGCETHRTRAIIKRQGGDDVASTWAYGLTSVITPERHRRKGHAQHLLRLLHYLLTGPHLPPFPAEWGSPPTLSMELRQHVPYASFSYLCSDVGSEYYETCTVGLSLPGYHIDAQSQNELTWKILPREEPSAPGPEVGDGWRILYDKDLSQVAETLSKAQIDRLESIDTSLGAAFALDPASRGTLAFVPQRGEFGLRKQWPTPPQLEPRGVQKGDTMVLFARYNYQIALDTLLITYTHNLHPGDLQTLLPVLDKVGSEVGLKQGWVWGLDPRSELVKAWEVQEGREAKASLRHSGYDTHLYGVVQYDGQGGNLVDQQMWIWL